jgi:hypothetical protein
MNRFVEAEQLHQSAGRLVGQGRFNEARPLLRKACVLSMGETLRIGAESSGSTGDIFEHYERLLATIGLNQDQLQEECEQVIRDAKVFVR